MKAGRLLGVFCALFLLHACSKKSDKDFNSNPELYRDFISGFTAGQVPAQSDFRVQLAFDKPDWKPNTELPSSLFDISPSVSGKVMALGNNTIAFIPKKPLENGKEYQIRFRLDQAISTPEGLEEFRFTVKTIKQDIIARIIDLQSYDQTYQYANGQLRSADALTAEEARKVISARFQDKDLKIKFDDKKSSPTDFRFIIDSIQRSSEELPLLLTWDGDEIDVDRKESLEFPIAAKGDFKVLRMEPGENGTQEIRINFSERLDKDQDFTGLVAVQNASNLRFMTQGNVLKVYFDTGYVKKKVTNVPVATAVVVDSTVTAIDTVAAVAPVVAEVPEEYEEEEEEEYSNNRKTENQVRLIEVFQGIRDSQGKKLDRNYSQTIDFGQIKPGVRLLKSGTILPASANLKINFEAANLNAVDVKVYRIYKNNILQFLQENDLNGKQNLRRVAQPVAKQTIPLKQNSLLDYSKWNTYALDLSKIIAPDPGAIYRVEFSAKKDYSLYRCENGSDESSDYGRDDEEQDENDVNYSYYDYDYYYDDYDWYDQENPCDSYFFGHRVGTNILASDLGVTVKRGLDKSYFVAVTDLLTTDPVSGANVELYSFQQQKIASGSTDGDGFINFKSDKFAYFAIVTKGKQVSYLKLDDQKSLSLSNFDVSGESLQKGLKGFIYGERGVWRPGDTMYLSFILNDNANKLPEMHPVKFRLTDPRGKVVFQSVKPTNKLNHYVFEASTDASAPTGSWEAMVSVGGARFYKNIKVETIKPNRLKIRNSFNAPFISGTSETKNTASITWLHGALAKGLKTDVQMKLSGKSTSFKAYPDYVFDDATRSFSSEEINIFSGKTDAAGQVSYTIKPNVQAQAPGMLQAAFITKVHEAGGDVSTDVSTADYSPYQTYVGMKTAKTNHYGMLETGKPNIFPIVSVTEKGLPKPRVPLSVKVYRLESRWWWDASADDLSRYNYSSYIKPYKEFNVATDASGKSAITLNIPEAEWGRFLIRTMDEQSGHATSQVVYIDWPSWSGRSHSQDGESATMLVFKTDKKKYNKGEKAVINFPSGEGGRALISIENGTKVLKTMWAKTKAGETRVEVPITEDMAPNIYIHISLLQPHANTKNDSPIRMYGVVPVEVVDPGTVLEPQLSMPAELRPNQAFNLKVSEKNGRDMTYTVAIVDEGLLDLTRFQTPNAWDAFYVKEALGIRTWDLFDDVIGAYGGRVNQVFAIGGDAALGGSKAKKANRFPPVVKFLGPFEVKAGKTASHNVQLPNYVGSVRVMVVAANAKASAYGKTEKTVPVKSPLMVLASLPRKITPSEKVTLPVTVFAMKNSVKNVSVSVKTSPNIRIIGTSKQTLNFTKPDEKMAYFSLSAGSNSGIGKVTVTATSGSETSKYEVEIDVMNPNPVTNTFKDAVVKAGSSQIIKWENFGETGTSKARLEVSSFPTIDLNRRLDYLIQYPHGCVEQTTSGAFPQLYLADVMDISSDRMQKIQRYVSSAISRIGGFQQSNGGLSYWPGGSYSDDWGTSYAGHFMIEAEKKGYALPVGFKQKWLNYQRKEAGQWRYQPQYGNDQAQAYRLYTLAAAGSPDLASMNRLRETRNISNEAKLRLAAAYAMARQFDAARSISARTPLDSYDAHYYYYGSPERNRAMELETLLLMGDKKQAFNVAVKLAKELSSSRWMSTQTTAFGLYAMSKFAAENGRGGILIDVSEVGKITNLESDKSIISKDLDLKSGGKGITIRNKGKNALYVRVLSSGILPVGKELAEERNLKMTTVFHDRSGKAIDLGKISQGTEVIAEISVTNLRSEYVPNLALTQILPSGYEIVNTRYTDYGEATANPADYIDIRDDRANYYFGMKAGETKTFRMLLNASYPGIYYLPGSQCEAMYDNSYLARNKGRWIEVR